MRLEQYRRQMSFKKLILLALLPVITVGMLLSGILSAFLAKKQMKDVISRNTLNTVSIASENLQEELFGTFGEFVMLENKLKSGRAFSGDPDEISDTDYMEIYQKLFNIYVANDDVLDCIFVGFKSREGKTRYICYSENHISDISLTFEETIGDCKLNSEAAGEYVWSLGGTNTVFRKNHSDENLISLFKVMEDKKTGNQCFLYFGFQTGLISDYLFHDMPKDSFYTVLAGENGVLMWPENEEVRAMGLTSSMMPDKRDVISRKSSRTHFSIVYDTVPLSDWKFAVVIDEERFFSFAGQATELIVMIFVLLLVIVLIIVNLTASLITRPIRSWVDKLKALRDNDFEVVLDENICYELAQFNEGLQYMMSTVKTLMANLENDYRKRRNLEFALLQEQINPHFLYNTLYSIQELYGLGEVEDAGAMMTSLSDFFRRSLNNGKELVTVREELAMIRDFLRIQQMRYDNFRYEIRVEDSVLDCPIVKFSLQPLIENAIVHGLYNRNEGLLLVEGSYEGENVCLRVIDNGQGMAKEQLDKLRKALAFGNWKDEDSHFGLRNVHERLKIYYGGGFGVELESKPGEGTVVTIHIPGNIREPEDEAGCTVS